MEESLLKQYSILVSFFLMLWFRMLHCLLWLLWNPKHNLRETHILMQEIQTITLILISKDWMFGIKHLFQEHLHGSIYNLPSTTLDLGGGILKCMGVFFAIKYNASTDVANITLQWRHMNTMVPQIMNNSIAFPTVCSNQQQRKAKAQPHWLHVTGSNSDQMIPFTMDQ